MPKKSTEIVTVKEFAARLGVSAQAVMRYMDKNLITERAIAYLKEGGKPKLIVEYAMADLAKNKDPTVRRRTRTGVTVAGLTAPRIKGTLKASQTKEAKEFAKNLVKEKGVDIYKETKPITNSDGTTIDFSRDPTNVTEARTRYEIAKALKEEIGVQQLRKTLVPVADQDIQLANLATNLKKDLGNVADRLAAPLAAETNLATVRNMIHAEIESILIKHSGPRKVWRN